ncbi:MAG: hypothetical protein JF615_08085 [Asticcacaulis sp.]|nr:hypothetical protein [Asticcacaulis sp.]
MGWLRSWILLFLLAVTACGPSPQAVMPDGAGQAPAVQGVAASAAAITETRYGDWPLWSKNRKYSASENAHYHFQKHGPEFGVASYEAWVTKVHGFIHNPPAGTETVRRNNGDVLMYDARDNVFAVMTRDGAPRTMFRPDDGAAYWRKQKEIEANRRVGRDPKGGGE